MEANLDVRTVVGGPLDVNTYVVGLPCAGKCILIDPGAERATVEGAVCGREVTAVLLTHAHFDHMLYAMQWLRQGAKLYVHEKDAPALTDPDLNASAMMRVRLMLPDADVLLHDVDVIREAGMELTIVHTPGHSKGSACLYLPDEKTMFTGDTLFQAGVGRMDLYGGSPMQMRTSLRKLFDMDGSIAVYPGHGGFSTIAAERTRYHV